MNEFSPEGILLTSAQNKEYLSSFAELKRALEQQAVLEARAAVCDSEHNLILDIDGVNAYIPREEGAIGVSEGKTKDIAMISRVNKAVSFIITNIDTDNFGKRRLVCSRRLAQERCLFEHVRKLRLGDVIDARVTHLEPFGAFVDIGCGLPALLPIDAISISRIAHPRDRLSEGLDIKAVIKSIEGDRICLSQKELLGTWEENAEMFSCDETVSGIVRSVEEYGIFVELAPNLSGLAEFKEGVRPGQQASVFIKSLIPEKMKIKLNIVDTFDAKYTANEPKYFFNGSHMEYFCYSPPCCPKKIESFFDSDF